MPVSTGNLISQAELEKWPYLHAVRIPRIAANVDLLIGTNASRLMEPREVISSHEDGPYAFRTLLGWVVNGPLQGSDKHSGGGSPTITVNPTIVSGLDELLINEVTSKDQEEISKEERKYMEPVKGSVQLKLPFRSETATLPNNICVAKQQIRGLERKLQGNEALEKKPKKVAANEPSAAIKKPAVKEVAAKG